jgi:hypothetical protein
VNEIYRNFKNLKSTVLRLGDLVSNGKIVGEIKTIVNEFYVVESKEAPGVLLTWHGNDIEPRCQLISNCTKDHMARLKRSRGN